LSICRLHLAHRDAGLLLAGRHALGLSADGSRRELLGLKRHVAVFLGTGRAYETKKKWAAWCFIELKSVWDFG